MNTPQHHTLAAPKRLGIALDGEAALGPSEVGWPHQYACFLAQSLRLLPQVEQVYFVVPDSSDPSAVQGLLGPDPQVVRLGQALTLVDVLIDLSHWVPDDWAAALRQRGGKIVRLSVENPHIAQTEQSLFGRAGQLLTAQRVVDAVWMPATYLQSAGMPVAVLARAPAYGLPLLWSPLFVDRMAKHLPKGQRFGYRSGRTQWRLAICESNQSMASAGHVPMLAAEAAYRQTPRAFEKLWVLDSFRLKSNLAFVNFASSLQWVRDGKASFEAHHTNVSVLSQHAEALLAHQWEGGTQVHVLEALYGAYPVVHNDPQLQQWGYAYSGFDCEAAGSALLHAKKAHDQGLKAYRSAVQQLGSQINPINPANVQVFSHLLNALWQ